MDAFKGTLYYITLLQGKKAQYKNILQAFGSPQSPNTTNKTTSLDPKRFRLLGLGLIPN